MFTNYIEALKKDKNNNPLDPNADQFKPKKSVKFSSIFWPSWQNGQYIGEKNPEARTNKQRLFARKIADIKEVLVTRHGKNVRVLYNRKIGAIIPTTGMSRANRDRLDARNVRAEKQFKFFEEDNHLAAITAALKMPRDIRRTLARKLGLAWGNVTGKNFGYREAEAMIREG